MSRTDDIVAEWDARTRSLYEVADLVESIPDEQFTLDHWWLPIGMAFDDWHNKMYRVADGPCGCAVGHLIQRGLYGLDAGLLKNERERIFVVLGDTFGINNMLAAFMFDQYAYRHDQRDKLHVVSRIRFVADEQTRDRTYSNVRNGVLTS